MTLSKDHRLVKSLVCALGIAQLAGCLGDDASDQPQGDEESEVATPACTVSSSTSLATVNSKVAACNTVWFSAGTYTYGSPIRVEKPTILKPVGSAKVIFDGGGTAKRGIEVQGAASQGSVIRGFTFKHYGDSGIHAHGSPGVIIRDNVFDDNGDQGLGVSYCNDAKILHNKFYRNGNFRCGYASGVKITNSARIEVAYNDASDNEGNGIWCDISCVDFDIHHNTADRNKKCTGGSEGTGIDIEISERGTIHHNSTRDNENFGIWVQSTAYVTIADNPDVTGNGQANFALTERSRTSPTKGSLLYRSIDTTIVRNNFSCPGGNGKSLKIILQDNAETATLDQMIAELDANVYATNNQAVAINIKGANSGGALASLEALGFEANGSTAACP